MNRDKRKGGFNVVEIEALAKECQLIAKSAELISMKASGILSTSMWGVIETAPRSGTWISVCIGWHNFDEHRVYFPETVKWMQGVWVDKKENPIAYEPTHWMYLPNEPVR